MLRLLLLRVVLCSLFVACCVLFDVVVLCIQRCLSIDCCLLFVVVSVGLFCLFLSLVIWCCYCCCSLPIIEVLSVVLFGDIVWLFVVCW